MKDRFSTQAESYSKFRPTYPEGLYEYVFSFVNNFNCAWDAGTGNGQVAFRLADRFKTVYGTDISEAQLALAVNKPNIIYSVKQAESSGLPASSVDLVTCAQAMHWFDIPAFFREAERVLKPEGVLAVWGYGLLSVNNAIDPLILHFYHETLDAFWDQERRYIEEEFASVEFPFDMLYRKDFVMEFFWVSDRLRGYFNSWSAVQRYIDKKGNNPVDPLMTSILEEAGSGPLPISQRIFLIVSIKQE